MVIALSIAVVIIAAMLPQLASINAGWESRQASSEALQNGRVLIDHINFNLIKAVEINDVSEASEIDGFIEFKDEDDVIYRYQVTSGLVQFGQVGSLADLAGPVSKFQVTCYDDDDLDTPLTISDSGVDEIRFVKIAVTMTNSASIGQDKNLVASGYLRTGVETAKPNVIGDESKVISMCKMDETHFLFADGNKTIMVLELDLSSGSVDDRIATMLSSYLVNDKSEKGALAQIDENHYIWAYKSKKDGKASVLTVNPSTWDISEGTRYTYDSKKGEWPALAQIDEDHFLCLYKGDKDDGWAKVLAVNTSNWTLSAVSSLEFDNKKGKYSSIAKIDDEHYLCVYLDKNDDARAFVMEVDGSYAMTANSKYTFCTDASNDRMPVIKIDANHYLCMYSDDGPDKTYAFILYVNTSTWSVTTMPGSSLEVAAAKNSDMDITQIDTNNYIAVYTGRDREGAYYINLYVNTSSWTIAKSSDTFFHVAEVEEGSPIVDTVNTSWGLCLYSDDAKDGSTYGLIIGSGDTLKP